MHFKSILSLLILTVLSACSSNDDNSQQTDIKTATKFVRFILDDKIKDAEKFILNDDTNKQYFESFRQSYHKKDAATMAKYKNADILINNIDYLSDSISIINYSNSYSPAVKTKLKLVRQNDKWLIDLKYTFSGNL